MKHLRNYAGSTLVCSQPSVWKQEYELRSGEELVGGLRIPNILGRRAECETADGKWVIEEKGFFTSRMRITIPEKGSLVSEFEMARFGEGKIRLSPTRSLKFKRNFWKRLFLLTTDMNFPLVTVQGHVSLNDAFDVKIDLRGENYPELPWLVFAVLFYAISSRRKARG